MAITRNLKQRTIPDVIKPIITNKTPKTLEELCKEVHSIELKINEIIKYINLQAQPDTIELSEEDLQRKKLLVQPSDMLSVFIDKSRGEEFTPKKKSIPSKASTELEVMEAGVEELKSSIGVDSMGEYIEDLIKKDEKNETPKKKKKKKGSFYY